MESQPHPQDHTAHSGDARHEHHLPHPHYHTHPTPQYFASSGGTVGAAGGTLTPEQNAENLAKYQHDHAAQLEQNRISHGGHAEGDDYTPSRAAHHHPHFHYHMHPSPQYFGSVAHDKPKSGTATPKEGDGEKHGGGIHLPHYHAHPTPQYVAADSFSHDKPAAGK